MSKESSAGILRGESKKFNVNYYLYCRKGGRKLFLLVTNNLKEMQDYVIVGLAMHNNVTVEVKFVK